MASEALPIRTPALRRRYTVTICAGSFLLFLVQPMIARMALPRLGGAPAVWNSAMLVYQALLLGGYAYAHALGHLSLRRQSQVHLALFALAALMLPIGLNGAMPGANANPFLWVPWLLVSSIGPLFFVIAAQAPLMQRWFAHSGGADPYPLYAASNLGSFGGLIAYPLVVEPLLPLDGQSLIWSLGYTVVFGLVCICAVTLPARVPLARVRAKRVSARDFAIWVGLAAIPSGLMLSTTTHLTTDIVAMPLLWVVPLGIYLLSFSVSFADRRGPANSVVGLAPLILLVGGGMAFANSSAFTLVFAVLSLILLFTVAVALHAMLFDRRPDASQLTSFYLAMSVGGVVGGLFCALLAPLIFDWGYEHPLLILATAAILPARALFGWSARLWQSPNRTAIACVIGVLAVAVSWFCRMQDAAGPLTPVGVSIAIGLALTAFGNRTAFVGSLAALMLTLGGWREFSASATPGAKARSFFGIYTVATNPAGRRMLVHGTTLHGLQDLRPGRERESLTYYAPRSGIGLTLSKLDPIFGPRASVGIVGLGAGTLACYAKPGQDWRFYEIDPAIVTIARDPSRFTFLSGCLPQVPIAVGDARIVLADERLPLLDVLVVDAFSSDAIPMHLLTREAMAIYRRRLKPGGLLMVHLSNRYLDLEPVLASNLRSGWRGMSRTYFPAAAEAGRGYTPSLWVALSPSDATLARVRQVTEKGAWHAMRQRPSFVGWSDDHASILPFLRLNLSR